MKIVYCIAGTYNSGGMERVLANKANYLVSHGYEVVIITTDQREKQSFFELDQRINCCDLRINYEENNGKSFLNKLANYPFKQWKHRKRLTACLKQLKADIVVSMFCNDASFLWKIDDGSKKVLEIHFSRYKRLQYGRKGVWKIADRWRSRMDERTVRKYDRFVVLTAEDKAYWGNLSNMIVIPNALSHCAQPAWTLDIIGDGEWTDRLQRQIKRKRLNHCVFLKPPTGQIEEEYRQASLLVLSSRYEGLPMVLLEAQSFGLPIVSFACKCGPGDVITDGKNGFLVSVGNLPMLADRIMRLMEDEGLRKRMGMNAYHNSKTFSEERIMQCWIDMFDKLVSQR